MNIHFCKYQGTGNDFIMIDNRSRLFPSGNQELVRNLCARRFGIGADGLILLEEHPELDFNMVYFNSDGRTSSMCGNGGRCIVQFAHDLGVIKNKTTFMAVDGVHDAHLGGGQVSLKMGNVDQVEIQSDFFFLNTGSPHYVRFVKDVDNFPVYTEGNQIRYNDRFQKEGTNVNFMEKMNDYALKVRTYERGVEDETWSCGTGVTACAIAASFSDFCSPVTIFTKGGQLEVSFEKDGEKFREIYLRGPAQQVFQGTITG